MGEFSAAEVADSWTILIDVGKRQTKKGNKKIAKAKIEVNQKRKKKGKEGEGIGRIKKRDFAISRKDCVRRPRNRDK